MLRSSFCFTEAATAGRSLEGEKHSGRGPGRVLKAGDSSGLGLSLMTAALPGNGGPTWT